MGKISPSLNFVFRETQLRPKRCLSTCVYQTLYMELVSCLWTNLATVEACLGLVAKRTSAKQGPPTGKCQGKTERWGPYGSGARLAGLLGPGAWGLGLDGWRTLADRNFLPPSPLSFIYPPIHAHVIRGAGTMGNSEGRGKLKNPRFRIRWGR